MLDWILNRDQKIRELRVELITQVRRELESALRNELAPKVEADLRREILAAKRVQIETEIRDQLRRELYPEVRAAVTSQLEQEIGVAQKQCLSKIEDVLEAEVASICSRRQPEIERQIRADLTCRMEADFKVAIIDQLRSEYAEVVKAELRATFQEQLRSEVETKMKKVLVEQFLKSPDFQRQCEAEAIRKLGPQIEKEVSSDLRRRMEVALKPAIEWEVLQGMQKDSDHSTSQP